MEPALSPLEKLTAAETHRLDRAIVAISVTPSWALPAERLVLSQFRGALADPAAQQPLGGRSRDPSAGGDDLLAPARAWPPPAPAARSAAAPPWSTRRS
ncbi:hypothetical protein LT493_29560 [Streptomyces tricolor]|nr:hypothetical protein [Streptomyces tricolor]